MSNKDKPPGADQEQKELTVEDLLKDLPLGEEQKKLLAGVINGVAVNLNQINTRLENLEKQPAQESSDIYEGLSADQKYQVMMAKATAPAAAQQQGLLQALLSRAGGSSGGGDLTGLVKSAETIQALRTVIFPEPTALQMAMEKAQVAQVLAQTRLMNKVAGRATSDYLDELEKEIGKEGKEEA